MESVEVHALERRSEFEFRCSCGRRYPPCTRYVAEDMHARHALSRLGPMPLAADLRTVRRGPRSWTERPVAP